MNTTSRCMVWRRRTTRSWWRSWFRLSNLRDAVPSGCKWRYVPRGTYIVRLFVYVHWLYVERWRWVTAVWEGPRCCASPGFPAHLGMAGNIGDPLAEPAVSVYHPYPLG